MPTLDWLNRDAAFRTADRVPTRVLRPHAAGAGFGDASAGNLLVQGDNLEALKALLPFYRGRVKCIFMDPPYNTKSAFEHYDDNLEHSQWLTMMLPRLQLLREFLREDGSIWVTIDDNEGHYLNVLMDEVFGRGHFRRSASSPMSIRCRRIVATKGASAFASTTTRCPRPSRIAVRSFIALWPSTTTRRSGTGFAILIVTPGSGCRRPGIATSPIRVRAA